MQNKRRETMSGELSKIKELMGDLDEDALLALVKKQLEKGEQPIAIIEACRDGMQIVGERFAAKEYFVSELIVSAEVFNEVMTIIGPRLKSTDGGPKIKVVFGTVKDDVHDIGKNLVVAMLRCNGFEVYDVGIDAPPQAFVDKVRETGATVVGLSGLLTVAFSSMKDTVEALKAAGLRDKVKVMIGGGMVNNFVCETVGADAWGRDAMEAVKLARSLAEVKAK
jgi:methylmalonyl-CoA mutase cobalamin-binding domain/chain